MKNLTFLLLLATLGVATVGCNSDARSTSVDTPSTTVEALEFKAEGRYDMAGFGDKFFLYRFDSPNRFVLYSFDSIYLLGEDSGETGISYGSIFLENGEFIGLSEEYLLFEMGNNEKIAVALEKKKNVAIGESTQKEIPFEELSDVQKNSFIYPVDVEFVNQ